MFSALLLSALLTAQTPPAGLTINVQKLPATYTQPPVVHLEFTDKGAVETCSVKQSSGSAGIDKVACQQAQAQVKYPVKKNEKLAPLDMSVAFVAAPAPAPAQ